MKFVQRRGFAVHDRWGSSLNFINAYFALGLV